MNASKNLGSLEKEIMDIMWSMPSCFIRDVHAMLEARRSIAYTTVMTVMVRLVQKGMLKRKKCGNTFEYSCACSKQNFIKDKFEQLMNLAMRSLGQDAVATFAEELQKLPEKNKQELISLLKQKKGK